MKKIVFVFISLMILTSSLNAQKKIYTMSELTQLPEYPGGDQAMRRYIAEHIQYPSQAVEKKIQGTVYVKFIINSDGTVSNVHVFQSSNPLLDDEALRVVRSLAKFKPGKIDGKPVATEMTIPIVFKL